jgi:DNA-binding CsgD family transcriptional regulator
MQTGSITSLFYRDVPIITEKDKGVDTLSISLEDIALMSQEAVYVIDFRRRNFNYIANNNLFLCGHSGGEALRLGYDFYPKVIHSDDLPLLIDMHSAMIQRLYCMNGSEGVNYFSFTVRIKNESGYLMVYHKIKPVFAEGKIELGLCMLATTVLDTPGHLRTYYKNGRMYDEYSGKRKWEQEVVKALTKREEAVITLANQGKKSREIAHTLHISYHTLRNIKASIYQKLNVHSMHQAIVVTTNHQLIFTPDRCYGELSLEKTTVRKKTRRLMTPDMCLRIQKELNSGQSVNSIAIREHIAESAIRYAIKRGKLEKIPQ